MEKPHEMISLVSLLAVLMYLWTSMRVGGARRKYGVQAPATTGSPEFERYVRVQMNTLEWMPIFLVSFWVFSFNWPQTWAAALGLVWIFGRILYALAYVRDPKARGPGFLIQFLASITLWVGAVAGVVKVVMTTGHF